MPNYELLSTPRPYSPEGLRNERAQDWVKRIARFCILRAQGETPRGAAGGADRLKTISRRIQHLSVQFDMGTLNAHSSLASIRDLLLRTKHAIDGGWDLYTPLKRPPKKSIRRGADPSPGHVYIIEFSSGTKVGMSQRANVLGRGGRLYELRKHARQHGVVPTGNVFVSSLIPNPGAVEADIHRALQATVSNFTGEMYFSQEFDYFVDVVWRVLDKHTSGAWSVLKMEHA